MTKLIRRTLTAAAVVIVLIVVAVFALFWYVDALARRGVEAGGTYALGVDTTVRSVNIGLLRGRIAIDGLNISNPEGFDDAAFLTMEDGRTVVALRSLREEVIRIPELHLTGVDVSLLRRADGRTNYQTILDNLERFSSPDTPRRSPDEPERLLVIDELIIRDVRVRADLAAPDIVGDVVQRPVRITVPIPEIRLEGVGRTGEGVAGTGVTVSELAGLLVEAVLAAAVQHGGDLFPDDLLRDLGQRLTDVGNLERLTETVEDLRRELEERLPEELRDTVREAPERLRELIPGRQR